MVEYPLKYGASLLYLKIPENRLVSFVLPPTIAGSANPTELVRSALAQPVSPHRFPDRPEEASVAIAVNDKTRPVPHNLLLPPLLEFLQEQGFSKRNITFYIASGTHLPMSRMEIDDLFPPEVTANYPFIVHNADDWDNLVFLGNTKRGTPIWVNRGFFTSEYKIVVGNVEPHHFAGFSGGYKTAAIGLAGTLTINKNHAMLIEPGSTIASYDDNPLRQDIEDIGSKISVHLALNAILNSQREIVHVLAGDPIVVMTESIPLVQEVCQIAVDKKFDLVIASAGGYPKDINLYQAQKALTHASLLVKDSGAIILVAECREGIGNQAYESFMQDVTSHNQVFEKIKKTGFSIGPHKALQFARICQSTKVILISAIHQRVLEKLLLFGEESFDVAVSNALRQLPPEADIAVMPFAINTIPIVRSLPLNPEA